MSVQGQERLEQVPPQPHAQSLREPPHAHGAPFLKFRQRANPTSANTIARITIEAAFIIDQLSNWVIGGFEDWVIGGVGDWWSGG